MRYGRSIVMAGVCVALMGAAVEAPEPVKFANPERVQHEMDRDPEMCRMALEGILTQAQADSFEAALAPGANEKLAHLQQARKALERSGLAATSKAVAEVDTAIAAAIEAVESLGDGG